jgi:excisionase family DNA binding protein
VTVDALESEGHLQLTAAATREPSLDSTVDTAHPNEPLTTVFTIEELAAYLRVNHKTVREAIARGEIPGVCRLGNTIRIHTATALAWLAAGQTHVSRKRCR